MIFWIIEGMMIYRHVLGKLSYWFPMPSRQGGRTRGALARGRIGWFRRPNKPSNADLIFGRVDGYLQVVFETRRQFVICVWMK
jgi:hypothetical protein